MDVLFLSCAYSETQKEYFRLNSKRGYQFAAQNLQEALIEGFFQNDANLTVLSIPSLSKFPIGCKLARIKDTPFVYKGTAFGSSIGYMNIPFLSNRNTIREKALKIADEWHRNSENEKVVFVYALLGLQMFLATEIKKRYPDVKLSIIVPDLPRFMGFNRILKILGYQERYFKQVNKLLPSFDGFVVLAEPMVHDLKIDNKPYIVVEGIYCGEDGYVDTKKSERKVILYTGNIGKRYGIRNLLEAFECIKDPNYKLQIRGTGDTTEVLEFQKKDSRIEYIGPLSKRELTLLQKSATVLVNPVSPDKEFTRFFFPSKTMDYLASGTPTIMFKLDCLPKEYYSHIFFFEDIAAETMANTLRNICEKDEKYLNDFGTSAARFIVSQKNPKMQVEKIIRFFKKFF